MSPLTTSPPIGTPRAKRALDALRSPASGIVNQGVRFALAGGTVMAVYVTTTTLLASGFGLPFQIALAVGYTVSLVLHFTLQRTFVWTRHEGFALPLEHQAARYLLNAGAQYGITAASVAVLPKALGWPIELVYLATTGVVVSVNFFVFRHGVFHAAAPGASRADEE